MRLFDLGREDAFNRSIFPFLCPRVENMKRIALALFASGLGLFATANATADAAAGKTKAETCMACHGPGGNSVNGMYPTLAGQTARYLFLQLRDFKEGRRNDPVMSPMAANLSREDMQDLADYFASQKPAGNNFKTDQGRVALGAKKADETLCTMCHLGQLKGQNEIPRLAGQQFEYVVKQLKDFKSKTRTNDAGNMTSVARTLSDEDIINLGHYITSLY
jgi:cytochrome c553